MFFMNTLKSCHQLVLMLVWLKDAFRTCHCFCAPEMRASRRCSVRLVCVRVIRGRERDVLWGVCQSIGSGQVLLVKCL